MVQTAKKLVTEERILLSLRVKSGEVLTPATAEMVKQLYIYMYVCSIKSAGSCQGYKIMFLLIQKKGILLTIEKVDTMLCRF
jgi:hypothetical protein